MTWDVTIADTFADSYIKYTAEAASAAAERAAINKIKKYEYLSHKFVFGIQLPAKSLMPGALTVLNLSRNLVAKISKVAGDPQETPQLH